MELMERWYGSCESVLAYLGIGSMLAMMFLTTADALGRYLFNSPVVIANEITEKYLLPMSLCLALSFGYRRGTFIRVTLLTDRLKKQIKLLINYFALIVTILYTLALIITTTKRAFEAMASSTTLANIKLPLWPAYLIVPVSLIFLTLVLLFDLPKVKRRRSYLFEGGKEEEISMV